MKTYSLDDLLRAIGNAVASANRSMKESTSAHVRSFFVQDEDGNLRPRTLRMVLPMSHVEEGRPAEGPHEVPESTLTHHHQVVLDTFSVQFDCLVEELKSSDDGEPALVMLALGGQTDRRSNAARIQIQYRTQDPPEGTARINDQLLKSF